MDCLMSEAALPQGEVRLGGKARESAATAGDRRRLTETAICGSSDSCEEDDKMNGCGLEAGERTDLPLPSPSCPPAAEIPGRPQLRW